MSTVTPRLVFLALSLSIGCGLFFLLSAHSMLQCVGVTGFTTLSRYTSTRIALVGGVFTTLPVLVLLTIPFGLDALFECPTLSLISVIVLIGAVQGCIGALVWKGKVYTVIDGETIPGVLGVGSAMLAGVLGGFLLVLYLHTFVTVRQCFFQKEKPLHGLASPLGMKVQCGGGK